MGRFLKGSDDWLQTIDDSEWDEIRKEYLEDEVRRICEPIIFDPESVPEKEERIVGEVFVPSICGTGRHLGGTMGNVMLKRTTHKDDHSFEVQVKVWTNSGREPPRLAPVHTLKFESAQDAEKFMSPSSKNNFAWV